MLLQEINYKMPIYKDCTLGEMMGLGAIVLCTELVVFSIIARILFGFYAIGVAISLVSFFHITKMLLNRLQRVKYGKPHGYCQHLLIKKLSEWGWVHNLYITRIGKWSVRRMP